MHDQRACAGRHGTIGKPIERFRRLIVHTKPAFDCYGQIDGCTHGVHAFTHQFGLTHQTSAEGAILHAIRRATDVEVDFRKAGVRTKPRDLRQIARLASAELHGERMLCRTECQQASSIAVQERSCRDHLGIKASLSAEDPVKGAAVPIRPVHHRGDGKPEIRRGQGGILAQAR